MKKLASVLTGLFLLAGCQREEVAGEANAIKSRAKATIYGVHHTPPRNFESSVLNEQDRFGRSPKKRVNGDGYGFARQGFEVNSF